MKTYEKLSDISELIGGYAFKSDSYVNDGIRVVRITNVQDGYFSDEHPCFYPSSISSELGKANLKENDLLMSLTGNIGRVAFLPASMLPAGLNQRVECIRVKNNLLKKYLFFYFRNTAFVNEAIKNSTGVAQLNLSIKWLGDHMVPIPERKTMELIVSSLEQIDELIEKCNKELEFYDELTKSRFNEMFSAFSKVELSQISQIIMGQSPESTAYNDDGIGLPFFQGKADYGEKYTIVNHYTKKWNKEAKKGYVLMSVRAPVGPVNIASTDCAIGRGLCAMNAKPNKANNEFLYNALNSMQQEIVLSGKDGSTFAAINKDQVYKLLLPEAPIELQNEFSEFVHRIDKLKFNVQKRIEKYKELLNKKMDE